MSDQLRTDTSKPRVAVLGTGTMGAPFAHSLLEAGFPVTVWNRTAEREKPLVEEGAREASDPADAVRDADVVLTMLFDADAVLGAADEFLPASRPGTIWMQSATVGPEGMRRVEAAASAHGITVVDAPVLGTKGPAEHQQVTVLASGDAGAVGRLQPVFDAIGAKTVVVGERLGEASALKLVCNVWTANLTAGTALSIALSRAFGLDPRLYLDAIAGSAADSPYARGKAAVIFNGDARRSSRSTGC